MLWLALLVLMGTCFGYFIPGPGCGTAQNEIKVMDKLPEDPSELAALFCVMTEDYDGYKRWRDAIPGLGFTKRVLLNSICRASMICPKDTFIRQVYS